MLELHFINVADGDAVLIEEHGEGTAFRFTIHENGTVTAPDGRGGGRVI